MESRGSKLKKRQLLQSNEFRHHFAGILFVWLWSWVSQQPVSSVSSFQVVPSPPSSLGVGGSNVEVN